MSFTLYNYKIPVEYTNNTEYRECFRRAFGIETERIVAQLRALYADFDTFEDETKDELIFDEPRVNHIMGEILAATMFAEPFRELYRKAAALVISESPDIGLAILMAFHFFQEFHAVLAEWFGRIESSGGTAPQAWDYTGFFEESAAWRDLMAKFAK